MTQRRWLWLASLPTAGRMMFSVSTDRPHFRAKNKPGDLQDLKKSHDCCPDPICD